LVELKNIMYRKIKITMVLSMLLLSSLFIPPILATAWWDKNWSYKIKITVDETKVDADLTDFPVMVYLNSSRIDWSHVQDDLDDLRFLDSTETSVLKAELEKYVANDKAWIWVKIPTINNAVDTYIYMYYGNTGAVSAWDAENVWESSAVMVQHMYDNPDTSHIVDSTSYSNDGTKKGANEPIETSSGKIDSAQIIDAIDDYIKILNSASLQISGDITISFWIKANTIAGGTHSIIEKAWNYEFKVMQSGTIIRWEGGLPYQVYTVVSGMTVGVWYYISITRVVSTTTLQGYKNSIAGTPRTYTNTPGTSNQDVYIGREDGLYYPLNGYLDEIRIYNVAKSAEWIKADYNSGADTLLKYSTIKSSVSSLSAGLFIGLFILFMVGVLILALVKRR